MQQLNYQVLRISDGQLEAIGKTWCLWFSLVLILATQISYIAKIKSGVIVEIQLWQKLEILLPKTLFSYITVLLCGVK